MSAMVPEKLWWPYATAIITILFLLKGSQPILTKMTMDSGKIRYHVVMMSALVDFIKIIFCHIALPYHIITTEAKQRPSLTSGVSLRLVFRYCVPSLCFMVGSNSGYYALQFIDGTTFLLLANSKIVVTVLLHSLVYRYSVSRRQWTAAAVVAVGCIVSQYKGGGQQMAGLGAQQLLGVVLTLVGVCTHVVASVWNEVLFKEKATQSIWLQNLLLYCWSFVFNIASYTYMEGSLPMSLQDAFKGFNNNTFMLAIQVAFYGLSVSICIKRLDNVVYMYITLMTPFLTAILSWWMSINQIHTNLLIGMPVTICGVVLYYYKPSQPEPSSEYKPLKNTGEDEDEDGGAEMQQIRGRSRW